MAIEIVDFPIKNGGSFHCYVSLPEGIQSFQFNILIASANDCPLTNIHPQWIPVASCTHGASESQVVSRVLWELLVEVLWWVEAPGPLEKNHVTLWLFNIAMV